MKKILSIVCFVLTLVVSGCQCDLSHKHYYNDRGVCNCGDDIAQELLYSDGEYVSSVDSVKKAEIYYYKFVANGEEGIDFYIEGDDVLFDRIEIRADGMLQETAGSKNYSYEIYTYNKKLTEGRMYYLKVTYKSDGFIKLIIKKSV